MVFIYTYNKKCATNQAFGSRVTMGNMQSYTLKQSSPYFKATENLMFCKLKRLQTNYITEYSEITVM